MDANKLQKLKDIGYVVRRTCDNCYYAEFNHRADAFGECTLYTYEHKKHTGPARQLSINRNGTCPSHTLSDAQTALLHGFAELVEDK
ncbi:MAG TPA: hypothetical protein VFT74_05440 [Isosphaeraceae bacterium]|nr:hypothetical protein [Isosphaeraceae bacterium]